MRAVMNMKTILAMALLVSSVGFSEPANGNHQSGGSGTSNGRPATVQTAGESSAIAQGINQCLKRPGTASGASSSRLRNSSPSVGSSIAPY